MDGEGDQYEERLREVFQSFDGSGAGSLNPEELAELCHALQLNDTALHTLLHTLLNTQDNLTARVEFEPFKDALIVVLSSAEEGVTNEEKPTQPGSPEVEPRFVKGGKRYGRRSTPEFTHGNPELTQTQPEDEQEDEDPASDDGTLPSKRECWNADVSIPEEYEAEGQLHLWNPDEPGTPRGSMAPLTGLEERLQSACQQLSLPLHGMATLHQLSTLCQHLGIEVGEDAFQAVGEECMMSVEEFISYVANKNKPPTPSASTPYRQLKRHHSMQPFDETGRRTSSLLSSTIGLRLFSGLDDGTGHTAVEQLLDTWLEDGVENCSEILQALDFSLDGKVNLTELTAALENELLTTKNSIHQAALVSFKAEIRHLLECADLELREKEKIRTDLEKAEKLKSQLASEVDEHHSAIERINDLNLRKLEQEHKDRMVALRAELSKEVELVQQQANQQREELEQEIRRIREDETFLREHLTLTIKENGRLESELLDSTMQLMEAEAQLSKLQRNLDSVLKEKFGDLDLSNAEFYQQEERLRQLRSNYEEQCRELQDCIDELQAQLEEFRALGRAPQTSLMPSLSDELESKSPGMESDQGLGSEEGQPFNMSLEAEMMLEQLKERHVREMENFREQLESTLNESRNKLEEQKTAHEEERRLLSLQHQQEIQALKDEAVEALMRVCDLQEQLQQEKHCMEVRQDMERAEMRSHHQQELSSISQEAQDVRNHALQLKEQLRELEESITMEREELSKAHADQLGLIELKHKENLEARLQVERERLQAERQEAEKRLAEEWEIEKRHLEEIHKEALRIQLEEVQQRAEQERMALERRLGEQWEMEKQQIEESNKVALQAVLEEELVRLLKEQEDRERKITEQWEEERTLLEQQHHAELQQRLQQEREQARSQEEESECRRTEEWERQKALLQNHYDGVLLASLGEQRERLHMEREEQERRWQEVLVEEQSRMEDAHREAMQELSVKHSEERERLSCLLEKLRTDIGEERKELEIHFCQRIKEVEARFSGDQETVSERFQADVHKLEQHYQSELFALNQRHAADRARWEEEMEAVIQEAEQQRKLLREALQLERENLEQEFIQEREKLDHSHAMDMEALKEKNLQLHNEFENFVSCAQTKEIELSRQLNELHNRLQENLEAKDTLLAHAECRTEELEQLLRQATDDFAEERAELQGGLSELEVRHAETLSLVEKQLQERRDLFKEREELKKKIGEMEKVLHQAVEDFHYERLELQGIVAALEEKLKVSVSTVLKKEEERTMLLVERKGQVLTAQQMESELGEATKGMTVKRPGLPDPSNELGIEFLSVNCIAVCEDETTDHQSEDFSVLGEDSPSAQDEELEGEFPVQRKIAADFDDTLTVGGHLLNICSAEILSYPEKGCLADAKAIGQEEAGELLDFNKLGSTITSTTVDLTTVVRPTMSFAVDCLADSISEEMEVTDEECMDASDCIRPLDARIQAAVIGLMSPGSVAEDEEDIEVREAVNEIPSINIGEPGLSEGLDIHYSSVDGLEEKIVAEWNGNAGVDCRTVEPDACVGVEDKTKVDGCAVNNDECKSSKALTDSIAGIPSSEVPLLETRLFCRTEDVGRDVAGKVETTNAASSGEEICKKNVNPLEFSNMQNMDHTEDKLEIAERIAAWCTDITSFHGEHVHDSGMTDVVEGGQGAKEAQENAGNVSDVAMTDYTEEPNILEVGIPKAVYCTQAPVLMREAITKDLNDDNSGPKLQDQNVQESPHVEVYAREIPELLFKDQFSLLELLQEQYSSAVVQNLSLQEQLARMQRHTDELELLLHLNRGKLEESHDLRVELITIAAQAKEVELKELELIELQRSYEESVCENAQLAEDNRKLEKRVQNLETKMQIIQEFLIQQSFLLEEIARMREENAKLRSAAQELEKQDEPMLTLQQDVESSASSDDSVLDSHLEAEIAAVSELEDCCSEFEKQNSSLRLALTRLQEKSFRIHGRMQEHRSEAGRLAEENLVLRQKISALREEDLRENQKELMLQVEHFRKERNAAQKMADGLKRQISELRRRGQQLEEENNTLSQQNVKHALSVDTLQHTLEEVIRQHGSERRELENGEDFAAPVITTKKLEEEKELLRAELNRCVEKMTRLRSVETQLAQLLNERQATDKHNQALRSQLMKAQEKVQALDTTLHGLTQQNARLKSDLRITQQERDAFKQEVISLHKQLQNANEKCRLVEMSISGGSQQGKRVWAELSGLMEAELTLLREENHRLQREINDARLELSSAREKGRQLEALVLSVKQQKQQNQASLAKAAEQERSSLKREIEVLHTQLHNKLCDSNEEQREMESLQEENEKLRNKQTILEAQLMEAQLIAMLPPSPLRLPGERRGQRHSDEMNPEISAQEEREAALLKMEGRMKEVELTLRNVKLLLQEKVSQLKEQLHKNSKADVLIKDLYVENAQLLKALEMCEQRHKVAEKKNYLLEEKISSLNKIVRELSPSPLTPVPYHFSRS